MLDVEGPLMDTNTILSVPQQNVRVSSAETDPEEAKKNVWHFIGPIFGSLGAASLWGVTMMITCTSQPSYTVCTPCLLRVCAW